MSALQKGILDSKKQSPVSLNRDTTSFKLYTRKKWMWFNRAENCIVASWKATFWIFQAISFFLRIIVTTTKIQLMFNLSHEQFFTANASHSLHALSSNFLYTCWWKIFRSFCCGHLGLLLSILYHLAISLYAVRMSTMFADSILTITGNSNF